jgi:integrase
VPDPYRALIMLAGVRGLRIGELCGLKVGDIDLLHGKLTVARMLAEIASELVEVPPKAA